MLLIASGVVLFLISILHQTTTLKVNLSSCHSCFLFRFYIKPQLLWCHPFGFGVVSYFDSTSNHNCSQVKSCICSVVSYFDSTSNHNSSAGGSSAGSVVSYFDSTSNHNYRAAVILYALVVSYFDSTSNHNWRLFQYCTTSGCFLFRFYIKPQRSVVCSSFR